VTSWRKRWLVLTPTSLSYYTSENKRQKKGAFKLSSVHKVDTARGEYKTRQFVFLVCCNPRTYYIQASNEDERTDWVNSINTAIGQPTIGPPPPKYVPQKPTGSESGAIVGSGSPGSSSEALSIPKRSTMGASTKSDFDDDDNDDDEEVPDGDT